LQPPEVATPAAADAAITVAKEAKVKRTRDALAQLMPTVFLPSRSEKSHRNGTAPMWAFRWAGIVDPVLSM
jgi:hypothetical protein